MDDPDAPEAEHETVDFSDNPPIASSTPKSGSLNPIPHLAPPPVCVSPRAGGYIRGLPSASNVTSNHSTKSMNQPHSHTSMSVFYAKSRDRRINLVLGDSEWDLGEELDICGAGSDTLADNMLAVTISCVMLMAADAADIPEEYFVYAENYLSCIKDDTDYHPPNVQGLLNHIAYLRETTNRTRDRTKESCKCAPDTEDGDGCNLEACGKRSTSRVMFKKTNSTMKSSRCRIPVRKKSYPCTK